MPGVDAIDAPVAGQLIGHGRQQGDKDGDVGERGECEHDPECELAFRKTTLHGYCSLSVML